MVDSADSVIDPEAESHRGGFGEFGGDSRGLIAEAGDGVIQKKPAVMFDHVRGPEVAAVFWNGLLLARR